MVAIGNAGVGKSALVAMLSKKPIPEAHTPTSVLAVTQTYWPVKMQGRRGATAGPTGSNVLGCC